MKCNCKKKEVKKPVKQLIRKAGKIVYRGNLPAIGVHITNERTKVATSTNAFGIFEIEGYDDDIIKISTVMVKQPLHLKLSELKAKTQLKDKNIDGLALNKHKNNNVFNAIIAIAGALFLASLTKPKGKSAKKVEV